jgi:hypothetical protein
MKWTSWSPGDLSRQELAVRRIALRAAVNRRQFRSARRRCAAQLGRFLGVPLGLIGCFVAGAAVRFPDAGHEAAATRSSAGPRRAFLPALLRGIELSALMYARWYAAHKDATAGVSQQKP